MGNNSITEEDVWKILKFLLFVFALSVPFIIWDRVNGVTNLWARAGILLTIVIVTPGLVALFIKSIITDGVDWTVRFGSPIIALVSIIGMFAQISYLADNWHWSAWFISLIILAFSGITWWQFTK